MLFWHRIKNKPTGKVKQLSLHWFSIEHDLALAVCSAEHASYNIYITNIMICWPMLNCCVYVVRLLADSLASF